MLYLLVLIFMICVGLIILGYIGLKFFLRNFQILIFKLDMIKAPSSSNRLPGAEIFWQFELIKRDKEICKTILGKLTEALEYFKKLEHSVGENRERSFVVTHLYLE